MLTGTTALGLALAIVGPGIITTDPDARAQLPPQVRGGPRHTMDAVLPRPGPSPASLPPQQGARFRASGSPTTLYVNFDGIDLDECEPSNAKQNCHWYNNDTAFPPFSGTEQIKISVLQAMRHVAADFGIRITGVRPVGDEDYTMVIYGGTEMEYGALGSAPSGDCGNRLPNQIAFAHLDGELNTWVNGGATTALHEAAHTWGLDHIDLMRSIMFPAGGNDPVNFADACATVVADTELTPGDVSCPDVNAQFCQDGKHQNETAMLSSLFGPAYVDAQAPTIRLVEPASGTYFQAPANFEVVLEVSDDLHPQAYSMVAWVGDEDPPERPQLLIQPGFSVSALPVGQWEFHVIIADEVGNESSIDFSIDVGEDPPPDPPSQAQGCGCRTAPPRGGLGIAMGAWLGLLAVGARRRKTR